LIADENSNVEIIDCEITGSPLFDTIGHKLKLGIISNWANISILNSTVD